MSLPNGTFSPASLTFLDKSAEKGAFRVYAPVPGAADIEPLLLAWTGLVVTIQALTLGTIVKNFYGGSETISPETLPASNLAQREDKFLVSYRDSITGKPLTCSLPTAKLSAITYEPNSTKGYIVMTDSGVVEAFVEAFEDLIVAPVTGNAVKILRMRFKGANN